MEIKNQGEKIARRDMGGGVHGKQERDVNLAILSGNGGKMVNTHKNMPKSMIKKYKPTRFITF